MPTLSRRSFVVAGSAALATSRSLLAAPGSDPPLPEQRAAADAEPYKFSLVGAADSPITGGMVHRANKAAFPVLSGVAAFSLALDPGAIRQPHLHTNANEISYIAVGQARVGLIGPGGETHVFELNAGETGVPADGLAALAGEHRRGAAVRGLHVLARATRDDRHPGRGAQPPQAERLLAADTDNAPDNDLTCAGEGSETRSSRCNEKEVFGTAGGGVIPPPVLPYFTCYESRSVSTSRRLHSSLVFETMIP